VDGHQDPDGCPDPDNDGDGVGDRFDGAPDAAETRNGWQDADGVPDELPPLLARFTGPQPRIRFDGNALSERGADAVETLADVLVTYPEVRVRVGVRDTELSRAESRAVTVAGALAQHGIVPERVVPYGEEGEPRVWIEILLAP
jgi:OOP family OmpA-OmpF porin